MIVNLQWEGHLLCNATAIGLLYEKNEISIAHSPDVYSGLATTSVKEPLKVCYCTLRRGQPGNPKV